MNQNNFFENVLCHIGNELYQQRHLKKEKITTVSSNIGVSHAVISRIENGRYNSLTVELLCKISDYYGVSLSALIDAEIKKSDSEVIEHLKSEVSFLRELYKQILQIKK